MSARDEHLQSVGVAIGTVRDLQGLIARAAERALEAATSVSYAVGETPESDYALAASNRTYGLNGRLSAMAAECEEICNDLGSYSRSF